VNANGVAGRDVTKRPTGASGMLLLAYLAALVVADAAAVSSVVWSVAGFAVVLAALLNHAAVAGGDVRSALLALSIVPSVKIAAVCLPQGTLPDVYWEALPAGVALVTAYLLRQSVLPARLVPVADRPARSDLVAQLPIALAGPVLAVAAAVVFSRLYPAAPDPALVGAPPSTLAVAGLSGSSLEIVFRGAVQPSLVRLFGLPGVVLATLAYAGFFVGSGSDFLVVLALVTGLLWGLAAHLTRRVIGVAASHGLFSLTWAALF
jgi:membrane protease YdiL (CAAX protease family)